MILVTGAAGKTGRAIIRALATRGLVVRAFVRRPEQQQEVLALGALEAVNGDLADRFAVERAIEGTEAVYLICPNVDPREIEYAKIMIGAAASAGIRQFGYHSVLHPQTRNMIHHWKKLQVEEALFQSGLPFTIMQPCAYMQNVLVQLNSGANVGVIRVPYSAEAKLNLVDLEDVAAAVATVLSDSGHLGAIYELAGPEAISHTQIAAIAGAELGRPYQVEQIGVEKWTDEARGQRMGEYQINALLAMFEYYDQFGFYGNPNVLSHLLGRPPNTFQAFIRREMNHS